MERSSNRILEKYLQNVDEITVITDTVFAMGKAIAVTMKIKGKKAEEESKSALET